MKAPVESYLLECWVKYPLKIASKRKCMPLEETSEMEFISMVCCSMTEKTVVIQRFLKCRIE